MEKTPAGFLRRGLNSSRLCCYFLQQPMLQHSLPLQHAIFDVVAAVAVLTKARRLRINKRCFINSSFDCSNKFGHADILRAEPSQFRRTGYAAAELAGAENGCLPVHSRTGQNGGSSSLPQNLRKNGSSRQNMAPGPNNRPIPKLNWMNRVSSGNRDTGRYSPAHEKNRFFWAKLPSQFQWAPPAPRLLRQQEPTTL